MSFHTALKLQQSPLGSVLPECWKLVPERAITLHPDSPGVLRVSQGRVWATLEGPHHGPANDWGDVVLRSGEQLHLQPGQQVVVEVYGEAVNAPAYFSWEPAPVAPSEFAPAVAAWGDALARPVQQTDRVLGRAVHRLACSLARIGNALLWLVPGRGQVLGPLEGNPP